MKGLWYDMRAMVHDQLTLATLEARLAGKSFVVMLIAGVVLAVLVISAWLGLMGAAVLWLASVGIAPGIGMLFAVAGNLIFAAILYQLILHKSRHLQFPATLRSLRPLPPDVKGKEQPR